MISEEKKQFATRMNEVADILKIPPKGANRQKLLGKMFQVSQESARKWLAGEGLPQLEKSIEIVKKAKVSIDWFLTGRKEYDYGTASDATLYDAKQDSKDYKIDELNIYASLGQGIARPNDEVVINTLGIGRAWADKNLKNVSAISNLKFIHGEGQSMKPTVNDGDIVLVDTGINSYTRNGLYVVEVHGFHFIKRITMNMSAKLEISSDNPLENTPAILNGDHEVSICAQVVLVWNENRV